jgi:hypothetical protein
MAEALRQNIESDVVFGPFGGFKYRFSRKKRTNQKEEKKKSEKLK